MINEETIVSVYNDKMTLLQFLKTVNKALDEAVLTSMEVSKKGNATLSFVFEFADGSKIESGEIVLQQGESVTDANIVDGHLYLTLSNGESLDAGNVKPVTRFEINASQHLIVYYGDGTSQDLGAILQGNVNIDGNLTANSIVETMNGYSFKALDNQNITMEYIYAGVVKNGNKLTIALAFNITPNATAQDFQSICDFILPTEILSKLHTTMIAGYNLLDIKQVDIFQYANEAKSLFFQIEKRFNGVRLNCIVPSSVSIGVKYFGRIEATFLLSDSMAV